MFAFLSQGHLTVASDASCVRPTRVRCWSSSRPLIGLISSWLEISDRFGLIRWMIAYVWVGLIVSAFVSMLQFYCIIGLFVCPLSGYK